MLFIALLLVALYLASTGYRFSSLDDSDYRDQRCEIAGGQGGRVLRILDGVYIEDPGMIDIWCSSPGIARHYSAVEVRSTHRDSIDMRELYESHYDLVLAKPELLAGNASGGRPGLAYDLIARYPDYGSQLVTMGEKPRLTAEWMRGKTLGLLDDPNSVSAYQIPKAILADTGLNEVVEIVYFRSYHQMYRALFDGRVDVIPALLSREGPDSILQLPPGLVLDRTIPGPGWFISRPLKYSPVHCDLLATLQQMAAGASLDYFRNLAAVEPCDEP